MTTVLLDTHVVQWWSAEPDRLSRAATEALAGADQLAVSAISWFELAWLAAQGVDPQAERPPTEETPPR